MMINAGGFLVINVDRNIFMGRGVTVEGNVKGVSLIFTWRLYF